MIEFIAAPAIIYAHWLRDILHCALMAGSSAMGHRFAFMIGAARIAWVSHAQFIPRLTLLIIGLLAAPSAWACECVYSEPDELVSGAAILFEGAMVGTGPRPLCRSGSAPECLYDVEGIFRVDRVLKGELGKAVFIRYEPQDGMNCGALFTLNETSIVAAYGTAARGYVIGSMCTQGAGKFGLDRTKVLEAVERYRQRLDDNQAAIDSAPGDPNPIIAKARFLDETNDQAGALMLLSGVLAGNPANRDAALMTAQFRLERREDELALAALDPYLARNPKDQEALHARAVSLIRLGRADEVPSGWRDFSKLTGKNLDFAGRTFDGASFRLAALASASFAGASLKHSDFSEAHLENVVFDGADLAGADLSHAEVDGSFEGVNLERAKLYGGIFSLKGKIASLEGADISGARFSSNLDGSGSLENLRAAGVNAGGAQFKITKMSGADFSGANLWHAAFHSSNLSGASFRGANLSSASLIAADLTGADLSLADLENADLRKASLRSSKLDDARLEGAVFDSQTTWPDGFDPIKAGARKISAQ